MKEIKVSDFTKYPGPRYISLGPNSGEAFRNEVLKPALELNEPIQVNLDNVFGYGSSFLEEAFGGLVRDGVSPVKMKELVKNLVSNDDPYLVEEITEYVTDALDA